MVNLSPNLSGSPLAAANTLAAARRIRKTRSMVRWIRPWPAPVLALAVLAAGRGAAADNSASTPDRPEAHTVRMIEGWKVRVDDRLLGSPHAELGRRSLRFLEGKLVDIVEVLPAAHVQALRAVTIVLDLDHGGLHGMQYHPSARWLEDHGYDRALAQCVHLCEAPRLVTPRNIREQPWCILHELAHAYHDQVLGFDEPRILAAYEQYRAGGHGEHTLLFDGRRVRHYALTDHKEFFAEMTEAYFGTNDFFPFNRAELLTAEPEIHALMRAIWEAPDTAPDGPNQLAPDGGSAVSGPARRSFVPPHESH